MREVILVFEPSGLRISVDETTSVLDAARMLGLYISSECGGRGTCGKCQIVMQPTPKPNEADVSHISGEDIEQGVRLACEHSVNQDTRVILKQAASTTKILLEGVSKGTEWEVDEGYSEEKGIAVDLGTTTIVAYLMNLADGVQVGQAAMLNPQIIYGEDVMSRINYATREDRGSLTLKGVVLATFDDLVQALSESTGVTIDNIVKMAIVGNPAMHHLLLGLDVSPLGRAPYDPVIKESLKTNGAVLGLDTAKDSEVYLAPNIAGFVGGDTAAFILSQRLDETDEIILGIDIGTNGEIVLSVRGDIHCCSAAAGSAFEGATIKHGMRGQEGAIEYLRIEDALQAPEISVIGDVPPKGLCGSGIVDTVAQLRSSGLVTAGGRLQESERVEVSPEDDRAYIVVDKGENDSERRIVFTQKDVRQVQLAKGAILTGASFLMGSSGIEVSEVDRVLLAGAFGNYIDPASALVIGLLPPVGIEKVIPVGNAAGEGAKKMLLSSKMRNLIEQIVPNVKYLELATQEGFAEVFAKSTILQSCMP
ncbi:MAG: ASKHA domain-containing protein [Promethearchaeota archaeon]